MSNKLYVGGISWNTSDDDLRTVFQKFGELLEVTVITDRDTGRSRGFGFVTFTSNDDATKAISKMDGTVMDGRTLTVNEARERQNKERGGNRSYSGGRSRRY